LSPQNTIDKKKKEPAIFQCNELHSKPNFPAKTFFETNCVKTQKTSKSRESKKKMK